MEKAVLKKVNKFFSPYSLRSYKKNRILIKAFENSNKIYFLTKGSVKMYTVSKNGKEYTLNIFKPYSFFPISSALNDGENLYYYEAITNIDIKSAPSNRVISFIKKNPDVMFDLIKRLYKGIDGLLMKMDFAMTSDAKSRLIVELITQAKRFGVKKDDKYEMTIKINELATTVGLTRETVSRQLKNLKEKRAISMQNKKIAISDINKLIEELS